MPASAEFTLELLRLILAGYQTDNTTSALVTVTNEHHHIHEGEAYLVVYSALKNNAETFEIRFQTADSPIWEHMVISIVSALAATIEIWKATTKTDVSNNRLTPFNHNQNYPDNSTLIVCHTPGGSQAGDAWITEYIGSASANGKGDGGGVSSRPEIILKSNTAYLLRVTSRANANAITAYLDYYSHQNVR